MLSSFLVYDEINAMFLCGRYVEPKVNFSRGEIRKIVTFFGPFLSIIYTSCMARQKTVYAVVHVIKLFKCN